MRPEQGAGGRLTLCPSLACYSLPNVTAAAARPSGNVTGKTCPHGRESDLDFLGPQLNIPGEEVRR